VHRATHNMAKYAGISGDFLGVLGVGYEPYTYSDASGTAALSITTKTGNWSVVQDGGTAGTPWGTIAWSATVPSGASVATEVRAADAVGDLGSKAFQPASNGVAFTGVAGRYLEVRVVLNANALNESPVVADVTIASALKLLCDADADGDVDQSDLALISRARGQTATGVDDPRDADRNGLITPNDVKVCTTKCTRTSCAVR